MDAVLDMVGKSTFGACRRILKPGGVYVSSDLGPFAQNIALPLVTRLGRGQRRRVVFPFPMETPEVLEHLRSRLESRAFRPVLDRTYPLEDIVEAYRYVESGRKVGSVLISVRGTDRARTSGPRLQGAAHDDPRHPARHGIRRADDLEPGLLEHRPRPDERHRRVHPPLRVDRVGLDRWRAVGPGVVERSLDEVRRHALAAVTSADDDAHDAPHRQVVGREDEPGVHEPRISDRGPMLHQPTGVPSR